PEEGRPLSRGGPGRGSGGARGRAALLSRGGDPQALHRAAPRAEGRAPADRGHLRAIVRSLTLHDAEVVTRAFAGYFQLVNLAEQHHRIRRARAHAQDPDSPPQPGSIEAVLHQAREAGVSAERMREALRSLRVVLTFTA